MGAINWNAYIKAAEEAGESLDEFTPIPADNYEVKALEAKATKTKSSGKDMIVVTWVVEGGAHAGRRVWSNLVVSPESEQSMGILVRQLTTLGVRPLLESGASFEQIAAGIKGAKANIKVIVGEYNGKPKNEVKGIYASKASSDPLAGVSAPSFGNAPAGLPI